MGIINVKDYEIKSNCSFIFDTNIWLYLFSSLHDKATNEIKYYSKFLEDTLSRNCTIYITSSIISEITNVILRAQFRYLEEVKGKKLHYKKDFVGSKEYENTLKGINTIVDSILSIDNIEKVNDHFNSIDLENIKNNSFAVDWNDSYLLELSKMIQCKILTNDSDFFKINTDIDIISLQA